MIIVTPFLVRPISSQLATPTNGYRAPTDAGTDLRRPNLQGVSGSPRRPRPGRQRPGMVTGAAATAAPGFKL